jgi:hypothetical protein
MEQVGFRPQVQQVDMTQFDNIMLNQSLMASQAPQ